MKESDRKGMHMSRIHAMILAIVFFSLGNGRQAVSASTQLTQTAQPTPAKGTRKINALSSYEKSLIKTAMERSKIICREHIILVWPRDLKPNWQEESGVTSPQDLADWLETAYRFSASWTRFDPNRHYAKNNGEYHRLVFIHNGTSDYIFDGLMRPYIGLRDLKNPLAGSEDWFGWLTHELSHDFWHEHPAFERVKGSWGEAMCDYERYSLLLNIGMPVTAKNWEQVLQHAQPDDHYRGGAWLFLKLQREERLDGPPALWNYLWDKDFATLLGRPKWEK
jgi:hypothetical protein